MADGKTYIVPTDQEPTFWNKEAAIGTFMFPVVGTVIGGLIGKARMEREKQFGKPIDPPSFWNKTTLIGSSLGGLAGLAVGLVAVLATISTGPGALLVGVGLGLATWLGTTVVAGAMGKSRIAKEYENAEKLVQARDMLNISKGKAPGRAPSPELAKELASGWNGLTLVGSWAGAMVGNMLGGAVSQSFEGHQAITTTGQAGGALAGGMIGKSEQEKRYLRGDVVTREEALEIKMTQMGASVPQRTSQITPEEARLLQERLSQIQAQSMEDKVAQLRDAPQHPSL